MNKYASTLNFFCSLHLGFLNGLPDKDFFNTQVGNTLTQLVSPPDRRLLIAGLVQGTRHALPLYLCPVAAGFPSPADDFLEKRLDLNEYLVRNPPATYLVRVTGHSMKDAGIFDGDILVVDKSLQPVNGCIVVAVLHGEFTVKTLKMQGMNTYLVPANGQYEPIEVTPETDCEVWGVVASVIRKLV
ncbi:MAG TPA: translesion error-prone DNA polymerase V autoproteolytic subunit [Desulfonatronum sp.]|nr:translesion error-prone DNA polymerase V autoproteolytic subunit [Desulfonatronum sp.]